MAEKDRVINVYNPKVKVTGWNSDDSTTSDNDPYNHCKRNYFLSTYSRLGSEQSKTPKSTTQEMLQQYYNSDVGALPRRKTKEFVRESCKFLMKEGTGVYPLGLMTTDYTTTNNYEYRHPFPHKEKPLQLDLSPPPPIHRRFHVDILKLGDSKFLDEKIKLYSKPHRQEGLDTSPYAYLDIC